MLPVLVESPAAVNRRRKEDRIAQENLAIYKRLQAVKPTPAVARDVLSKHFHDQQGYGANVRKFRDQGGHQAASNSRASPASLHSGPSGLYVPSLDEPLAPAKHSQYSLAPVASALDLPAQQPVTESDETGQAAAAAMVVVPATPAAASEVKHVPDDHMEEEVGEE
ncbi:uncharacterized protein HaLaN_01992, partial [Haematococcus lacustris]